MCFPKRCTRCYEGIGRCGIKADKIGLYREAANEGTEPREKGNHIVSKNGLQGFEGGSRCSENAGEISQDGKSASAEERRDRCPGGRN